MRPAKAGFFNSHDRSLMLTHLDESFELFLIKIEDLRKAIDALC